MGATGSLVAVETIRGYSLADTVADALACSAIGAHPHVLMLISVQRKHVRGDDGAASAAAINDAAAATNAEEPVVEVIWEYIKGYSLEKMILSGGMYSTAHHPPVVLDSVLRR
jgi:hypothetical protein